MTTATARSTRFWVAVAAVWWALDQAVKAAVEQSMALYQSVPVAPFFNWVRVHNEGAAFSLLADAGGWQRWFFLAIGVVASVWLVYMLRQHAHQWRMAWGLSAILGGALGNVTDRVIRGHVIDYLDFHHPALASVFVGGHFPAFNVADLGITLGATLLVLDELQRWRQQKAA